MTLDIVLWTLQTHSHTYINTLVHPFENIQERGVYLVQRKQSHPLRPFSLPRAGGQSTKTKHKIIEVMNDFSVQPWQGSKERE